MDDEIDRGGLGGPIVWTRDSGILAESTGRKGSHHGYIAIQYVLEYCKAVSVVTSFWIPNAIKCWPSGGDKILRGSEMRNDERRTRISACMADQFSSPSDRWSIYCIPFTSGLYLVVTVKV
jgi:hypothetical protein